MVHEVVQEQYLTPNEKTVLKGYKECRDECRDGIGNFKWAMSNLSAEQKYAIWALMSYVSRCWQLLELDQNAPERDEVLNRWREENSDWFEEKFRSAKLVALLDATTKFGVPKENLLEMLKAVEQWLQDRKFADVEALQKFSDRFGGAAVSSLLPILGLEHGDELNAETESAAREIGRNLTRLHLLSRFSSNLKRGRVFLPMSELEESNCKTSDLCMGKSQSGFSELVIKHAKNCEKELLHGSTQLGDLSFDGVRVMKSVLSMALRLVEKIREEPEAVLKRPIELSSGEQFKFQLKHVLGMEGGSALSHLGANEHH